MSEIPLSRWVVVVTLDPQYGMRPCKSYLVAPHLVPIMLDAHIQISTMFDSMADAHDMIALCKNTEHLGSPIFQFHVAGVVLKIRESGAMFLVDKELP